MCFLGSSLMGEETHKQNAEKILGQSRNHFVYVFFFGSYFHVTQSHPSRFSAFSVFSRADSPHFPFFGFIFAVLPAFCSIPGLICMFRIFYALNMRKTGMTGFVRDGFGCKPLFAPKKQRGFLEELCRPMVHSFSLS